MRFTGTDDRTCPRCRASVRRACASSARSPWSPFAAASNSRFGSAQEVLKQATVLPQILPRLAGVVVDRAQRYVARRGQGRGLDLSQVERFDDVALLAGELTDRLLARLAHWLVMEELFDDA